MNSLAYNSSIYGPFNNNGRLLLIVVVADMISSVKAIKLWRLSLALLLCFWRERERERKCEKFASVCLPGLSVCPPGRASWLARSPPVCLCVCLAAWRSLARTVSGCIRLLCSFIIITIVVGVIVRSSSRRRRHRLAARCVRRLRNTTTACIAVEALRSRVAGRPAALLATAIPLVSAS